MEVAKKFMGLDYGERRIGVALSDVNHSIATGYTTIDSKQHEDPIAAILNIVQIEPVGAFVVGYPLRTDNKISEKAAVVDQFIASLESASGLPVFREDERYSTVRAQEILRGRSRRQKKAGKSLIDRVAASIILQDFLDRRGWEQ